MGKEQYKANKVGMKIDKLSFSISGPQHLRKHSLVQCVNKRFYEDPNASSKAIASGPSGMPSGSTKARIARYGVLDLRLGTSTAANICETCNQKLANCIGHFGHIDLPFPVFHTGYFRFILLTLQSICKKCSRLLLPIDKRREYLTKIQRARNSYLERKILHDIITKLCKKQKCCPHCKAFNGTVKKTGCYKILHQTHPIPYSKATKNYKPSVAPEFHNVIESNPDLEDLFQRYHMELLDPIKVQSLFERIPDKDIPFLLITNARPEDLITSRIPVPPACIRPSVMSDDASNEDDLTILLSEINLLTDVIEKRKATGAIMSLIVDGWDFLQLELALYINSETSGIPLQMKPKKSSRGLVQRLKGKHGRFRGNLSGKRVDFSSRSVISPNPMLAIDQVGVPKHIARLLTYPERVTSHNLNLMRSLVKNGPINYPGANYIIDSAGGRKFLMYGNKEFMAKNLRPGDLVERHMIDGDVVLFNRQPSLHKLSIMCHKAKVHENRTLQFNECVCTPYNADFDGDEMNLHLLQSEEAKAEAFVLMGTKNNMVTPRNGEPLIAAIQDFITGAYLLTQKDIFFDRGQAQQLISSILASVDKNIMIDFPPPCIIRPMALWSGKQIFSLILRPTKKSPVLLNTRCKTKNYSGSMEELNPNDSFVVVRNSELLAGQVDKTILGSGSKSNIFYLTLKDFSGDDAGNALCRLARTISSFMANRGFSLGIDDVTPTTNLESEKQDLLRKGYNIVRQNIIEEKEGRLQAEAGLSKSETLEAIILKELSSIREAAGKSCREQLLPSNAALIMAQCGSKGSLINVSQMVACVGQQAIRGQRVADAYNGRSLPHFDYGDKSPVAKGFVSDSFYSGLTTIEFFFHTMAGREGLLDTAVKTAETGYMQRRLVKALEDLVSHYDGSVRNSTGELIQLVYGDDGLDPAEIDTMEAPHIDIRHLFNHSLASVPSRLEPTMTKESAWNIIESVTANWDNINENFKREVINMVVKYLGSNPFSQRRTTRNCPTNEITRLTASQLNHYLKLCWQKYNHARIEPGTAVGAICAQSVGEPATQMTLKTFHFAGVASMNITQGVPRIKELINAYKTISTPVIRVDLMNPYDQTEARRIKMRIENTLLGQVCSSLTEVVESDDCYIEILLDERRMKMLSLDMGADQIVSVIARVLRITLDRIRVTDGGKYICVRANKPAELWQLRESLCLVPIKGIPKILKAAIRQKTEGDKDLYYIVVEGEGLQRVMATYGVLFNTAMSNNVLEVATCLGIEAARECIINEIQQTMQSHGIGIDDRHLKLLADTMTYKGRVLGYTRHGLSKMKESALMLASFERTADHLFEAAYYGQNDPIAGVSESIISGTPIRLGTGFFDLLYKPNSTSSSSYSTKLKPISEMDITNNSSSGSSNNNKIADSSGVKRPYEEDAGTNPSAKRLSTGVWTGKSDKQLLFAN